MRTETRKVVDKPTKPLVGSGSKPSISPSNQSRGGISDLKDLQQKYKTGLQILGRIVLNFGGIEKARENEEYQKMIKIMAKRFKQMEVLLKNESKKESKKEV